MEPTLDLTFDSVFALLRTHGFNTLEKIHEDVKKRMPNTTFDCSRLTILYPAYKIFLQRRPSTIWSKYEDM
jgi:hypothetical protein